MVLDSLTERGQSSPGTEPQQVCPLCGTTYRSPRRCCLRCDGTPVVSVTDAEVYETVVPMCGPDCRRDRPDETSTAGPSTRNGDTLTETVRSCVRKFDPVAVTRWIRHNCNTNG